MARLQRLCWILVAAVAVALGVAVPAAALEVELPAEGAARHDVFTIRGLTIPQPPVDVGDVGGNKLTVNLADEGDSRFTAHNRGMYWYVHQYAVEQGYAMEYGWGSAAESEVLVEVEHAIAGASVVAVFDSLVQELAVVGEPTKTYDSPPQPFDIVLFEEGSAALRMEGLDTGATVHYLYGSPGHRPVALVAVDGGPGDNDGVGDGRITVAPPRNRRVPFVLAGDTILAAVVGADVRGIAAASAGGRRVRYTVPVVSRVRGATGSVFVSDLEMANAYGLPVQGYFYFVPSDGGVAEALEQSFSLAPGQTVSIDDVLASVFDHGGRGSGALHLGGFPLWSLSIVSRNFSETGSARYGVSVPGLPSFAALTSETVWSIPGVSDNSSFRCNLFLTGASDKVSEVEVYLIKDSVVLGSMTVMVPPYGLRQVNRVVKALGVESVSGAYLLLSISSGAIHAGLSVVDSTSDDASFIVAQPVLSAQ